MGEVFNTRRQPLRSVLVAVVSLGAAVTFAGAQAQGFPQNPPCPTNALAPFGIVPGGQNPHCPNGCLVNFAGYKWWTGFQYVGPFYNNSFYYNGGLGTPFAPEHAFVAGDGFLHLKIAEDVNLGGPPPIPWTGGEAVLMFKDDNSEANLGYGDYLITAKLLTAPSLAALDPNAALGVFTYERYGPPPEGARNCTTQCPPWPSRGGPDNPYRETDLAEISRWGWDHTGSCPFGGFSGQFPNDTLCKGNAQFATQDFSQSALSVKRYDIGTNQVVTLVMRWHKGGQPITFEKYNGAFDLNTLPSAPDVSWTSMPGPNNFKTQTPSQLDNFIPNTRNPTSCERFHINFWLGSRLGGTPHPGPSNGQPQEAVITNFEFKPVSPQP
jgi:hypothetical protein